ncbi:MAG: DUF2244 domain-containing protein [Rhodobacter sp.]|nr:DUF2244 domain-containing protein [Rhodobacter sp.]
MCGIQGLVDPGPRTYTRDMPYQWIESADPEQAPTWQLSAWPHRSLPPHGFAGFIGITFLMLLIPLFAVLGSPILWGLLPFLMGVLALTWAALKRSYADGDLREDLALCGDTIELVRTNPRGPSQSWHANPYWVRVEMHQTGGPVENYVTLTGAGRSVEIGAFLSPEERVALHHDLAERLGRLDINAR